MHASVRVGFLALTLLAAAGCMQIGATGASMRFGPTPEEMRQALLTLLHDRPDISIPEFKVSLEDNKPVTIDGIVYFGSWNCDPQLQSFIALFSAPNITMYEISGRFQLDARGVWRAIPRRVLKVQKRDLGEFWRPHEVSPI